VEAATPAGVKKKAKNEGRTIVFLDESGLSERPHRCRTWSPRGPTPVLQDPFNWQTLQPLQRHLPGSLLIIWDGLPGHRSRGVGDFVRQQRGHLGLEFLPGYAPELNPVEYLWSHWKQHELPNFCPQSFAQLSVPARRALRRMRRRPTLVCAFWEQAELFPWE